MTSAHPRCRCGHEHAAHEHYRRGTDCALCDCRRYRRPLRSLLSRLPSLARADRTPDERPDVEQSTD
ncbi:hypothetical protein GCM10022215_26800 [Nocardioides fonticola]|uniref:Uncharacterized protein n=1 Tax=Nocardioides fonticola TaxID=450363 RepID=A0ABP7XM12_9ACTN